MDSTLFYNLEYTLAGCAMACILFAGAAVMHQWRCRRAYR